MKKNMIFLIVALGGFIGGIAAAEQFRSISYMGGNNTKDGRQSDLFPPTYLTDKITLIQDGLTKSRSSEQYNPDCTEVDQLTDAANGHCIFNKGDGNSGTSVYHEQSRGQVSIGNDKKKHQGVLSFLWNSLSKKQLIICALIVCTLYLQRYDAQKIVQHVSDYLLKFFQTKR